MKKNKKLSKLSALGYLLLLSGLILIIIPLFKRSYNQIYSNKKLDEFYQAQLKRSDEEVEKENAQIDKYNHLVTNSENTSTDPFLEEENDASLNFVGNTDDPFGYLIIPKIEKRLPIYLGASMEHLDKGIGQLAGTHIPVGGKGNRSVLAGHRGWWGDTMLFYADEIEEGDYIYIQRANKLLRYIVENKEVISKHDWDKLDPVKDKDMITLLTCLPMGAINRYEKRLIIDTVSDEKFNAPKPKEEIKETNLNTLEVSHNQNEEIPTLVKTMNLAMLLGAILAILLFIFTLIKFLRRIKNTFLK